MVPVAYFVKRVWELWSQKCFIIVVPPSKLAVFLTDWSMSQVYLSLFLCCVLTDVQIFLHSVVSVAYFVKRVWELWSQKCVLIVFAVNVNSQLTIC
jgi:hypothetical protein